MTTKEVARLAGCSPRHVARACESGDLAGTKREGARYSVRPSRRKVTPRLYWEIEPAVARKWAESYRARLEAP